MSARWLCAAAFALLALGGTADAQTPAPAAAAPSAIGGAAGLTAAAPPSEGRTAYEMIKEAGGISVAQSRAIEAAGELNPMIFDAAAKHVLANNSIDDVRSSAGLSKTYVADLMTRSRLQAIASHVVVVNAETRSKLAGALGSINAERQLVADLPLTLRREIDEALASHRYVVKPLCPAGAGALLAATDSCIKEQPWSRALFRSVVPILLDGKQTCSGTAIGAHLILTAAHCVISESGTTRAVVDYHRLAVGGRSGAHLTLVAAPRVPQEMLAGNCLPDCFDMRYDFAVLQVDPASDGGWTPLSIVTKIPAAGDMPITIAGYGVSTLTTKESPDGLFIGKQQLHLAATADALRWGYKFAVDPLSSSCGGDSGGPVYLGNPRKDGDTLSLVGIISSLSNRSCFDTSAVAVNLTVPGPAKALCSLLPAGTSFCGT